MEKKIEIEGVGPVNRVEIHVPEGGGIVVLRGRNGAGKSLALAATDALLTGEGRLTVGDEAAKATAEGLGAKISVSRKTTRTGEIVVDHLEGVNPSDLIDPGIKDEAAADAARIKALCVLAGASTDPAQFESLVPKGEGQTVLHLLGDVDAPDLPTLAGRLKRALEGVARKLETEAEGLSREAQGLLEASQGAPDAEPDIKALGDDLEQAVRIKASLEGQAEAAKRARAKVEAAKADLAKIPEDDPKAAEDAHAEDTRALDSAKARVAAARQALQEAEAAHGAAQAAEKRSAMAWQAASTSAANRARLVALIEGTQAIEGPTAEDVDEMLNLVEEAREALRAGTVGVEAFKTRRKAEKVQADSEKVAARGVAYREAAAGVEARLGEILAGITPEGLSIRAGRVMMQNGKRGKVIPYAELSPGERSRIAIEIACRSVKDGGIIVLEQEIFEGLDATNRREIAALAQERKVAIITAEATDGDLVVEEETA